MQSNSTHNVEVLQLMLCMQKIAKIFLDNLQRTTVLFPINCHWPEFNQNVFLTLTYK